jgi:hypothetical protein
MGIEIIGLAEPYVIRRARHCTNEAAGMFSAGNGPAYPSCIYFVGGFTGHIKIGIARNPHSRIYSMQTGSPVELTLYAYAPGTIETERALHQHFQKDRCHGEWFERTTPLMDLIGNVQMQHAKAIGRTLGRKPAEVDFEL